MPKILPEGVRELPPGINYTYMPDTAPNCPHMFRVKDPHSRKRRAQSFTTVREGMLWARGILEGMRSRMTPTGRVAWATVAAAYQEVIREAGRRDNYLDAVGRVCRNLSALGAGDITQPAFRELVRNYLDTMVADADARKPGAELSPATKTKHLAIIRAVCHYAQNEHRIPFDPVGGVKPPKVRKKITQTLTLAEAMACVSPAMEGDRYFLRFALLLYLGLRERSEGLWLRWGDYDSGRQIMQVREREGENELKTGEREVPVPDELAEILARTPRTGAYILTDGVRLDDNGNPIEDRTDYARFKAFIRRALLPKDATYRQMNEVDQRVDAITRHSLRHLYARVMSATGVSISALKDRLGHTSISTTAIYAAGADSYERQVEGWKRGQWMLRTSSNSAAMVAP